MDDLAGLLIFLVIDVFFIWTGEVVKWVFTLGRYQPTFGRAWLHTSLSSLLLGLLVWGAVGASVLFLVIR